MLAIDKQYLQTPFYGRRRMTIAMRDEGFFVGQKKARTAMQTMGLEAIYPKPNLSLNSGVYFFLVRAILASSYSGRL